MNLFNLYNHLRRIRIDRKTIIIAMSFFIIHAVADSAETDREITPPGTRGSVMIAVSAGDFMIGINPETDDGYDNYDDEKPYRKIYIDKFYIDKYEATVEDYKECVKARECKKLPTYQGRLGRVCNWQHKDRLNHPINCLSWEDADKLCKWAGKQLPTEAEWEKAARGVDGRKFPWGNQDATCEYASFHEKDSIGSADWGCGTGITSPVGSMPKGVSPYGAMDMIGNANEWVSGWYFDDYYRKAPRKNPPGAKSGLSRIARGGAFNDRAYAIRVTYRNAYPVADQYPGVRCVLKP